MWIERLPGRPRRFYVWAKNPQTYPYFENEGFSSSGHCQPLCDEWVEAISKLTGYEIKSLEPGEVLDLKTGWIYYDFKAVF